MDKLDPRGLATSPSWRNLGVLMSQRFTYEAAEGETRASTPAPAMAT